MTNLNDHEKNALQYYIGDVSGTDPFWSDPKAYVVLNTLFFNGTETEQARAAEGKFLNPAILKDEHRLTDLLSALFSAFHKCSTDKELHTFRVERWSDYLPCRSSGRTISFMSTSTAGFLSNYRDRLGIALMKFTLHPGTPCIDIANALDFYAKPDEAEILLPPFLELKIAEIRVSESEKTILDSEGKTPRSSCMVTAGQIKSCCVPETELPYGGTEAGQRVFRALNEGMVPSSEDDELFSQWKAAYVSHLHHLFLEQNNQ